MKVTLELQPIIDDTAKVGTTYKISNIKFDNIVDVDTILNTKLTAEENTRYADMVEAMAEYFSKLSLALHPAD